MGNRLQETQPKPNSLRTPHYFVTVVSLCALVVVVVVVGQHLISLFFLVFFFAAVDSDSFLFCFFVAVGRVLRHTWYSEFERGTSYFVFLARSKLETRIFCW